jgi:hypothetical protein
MTASTRNNKKTVKLHDYNASHMVWCTNRDAEFTMHSDDEPYCSHTVTSIGVIHPEGDAVKCQAWVTATRAFTHGQFTPADYAEREQRYGGVEIVLETWRGRGEDTDEQKIRITSHAARTLAAALIRAADIEQGLNL